MLTSFLALLVEGVTQPRTAVRRVIDARPAQRERLLLVAFAAALQAFLLTLAALVGGSEAARVGVGGLIVLVGVGFVNYAITATLAFHIGRRFGGTGEPEAVATAVAWHAVLSAALSPLQAAALDGAEPGGQIGAFALISLFAYAGLNIWLLGACVAEAHRFRSAGRVAAATAGLFLALGVALWLVAGALRPV